MFLLTVETQAMQPSTVANDYERKDVAKQRIRQMFFQALTSQNKDCNEVHKNGTRLPSSTDVAKWGILNLAVPTRTSPMPKLEAKIRQYQFHRQRLKNAPLMWRGETNTQAIQPWCVGLPQHC